jgi:hypothetical protein
MEPNLFQYNFLVCGKLVIKMSVTMSILIFLMATKVTQLSLAVRTTLELTDKVCYQVNYQSLIQVKFVSSVTLLSIITQWLKDAQINKDARTKTNVVLKPTWKKIIA